MSSAKITMIGLEKYLNMEDKSLFDGIILPDGIVKADLINSILMRAGDFEVLYPQPDFFADAIKLWFRKNNRMLTRWIAALNTEYNPLENYDRIEEFSTHTTGNNSSNSTGSDSSDSVNSRSAYDTQTFSNDTMTENTSNTSLESSQSATSDESRTGRTHGNIGVTTSQQMLQAELDIARWNLLDQIADIFVSEFCLMIY